jgi:acyl dehydratase
MSAQEPTTGHGLLTDVPGLLQHTGDELGPTEWRTMTQALVDRFADVTEDHNFIHVDPERARQSPFGGTIAHGYLTLSLLAPLLAELLKVEGASTSINYGLNKLRFPAALPVGAQFRARATLTDVTEIPGGVQITVLATVEVRAQDKPALVAECLFRHYS